MIDWIRFVLSAFCLGLGLFAILTSVLGVFRFHFAINRMQCASIVDTAGLLLVLLGLCIAVGEWKYIWKMALIVLVLWTTSPLSSHLLCRMELDTDESAKEHMKDLPDNFDAPEKEE